MDGYPCKSLSKQNHSAKSILDTESKSGQGFKALLDYCDFSKPAVVVCENVATMGHARKSVGGEKPIAIQNQEFDRRGYAVFHQTLNSKSYGLRQCRTRVYSIYAKKHEMDPEMFLGCVKTTLFDMCYLLCPLLHHILLNDQPWLLSFFCSWGSPF